MHKNDLEQCWRVKKHIFLEYKSKIEEVEEIMTEIISNW